jgi:hypothetical protein
MGGALADDFHVRQFRPVSHYLFVTGQKRSDCEIRAVPFPAANPARDCRLPGRSGGVVDLRNPADGCDGFLSA